jgi:hypothetical protein
MSNLDFFYLNALNNYRLNNIIFVYKKTIYKEFFIFVKYIYKYIYIVNKVTIQNNLSLCLCNFAII